MANQMAFNPSQTMNQMMMTNHIQSHFSNMMHKNTTSDSIYSALTDTTFMMTTIIMFLQIIAVSMFSAFSSGFASSVDSFRLYILDMFRRYFRRSEEHTSELQSH